MSISALLCRLSELMCTKHLTESLTSLWYPNLCHSHPILVDGFSVLSGQTSWFVLDICFHPTSGLSVNPPLLTTSVAALGRTRTPSSLIWVVVGTSCWLLCLHLASFKSLVNLADRVCHCKSKLVYHMSLLSHLLEL